jgi:anti-anti-sigma regulatory factor
MLRITQMPAVEPARSLRLEGKLVGPWLDELRQACQLSPGPPSALVLDLSGVSFVDSAGAQYLRTLVGQGAQVTNCSPFVSELLKLPLKEAK